MICWYCHWGWPRKVMDVYEEAKRRLGGDYDALHFGPAHVVWDDENWDSVEWCLEHFDEHSVRGMTREEADVVRWSLLELAKIPLPERDPCPDEYGEDCDPEDYPPPAGAEMVKP